MIKIILLILTTFLLTACVNKRGISAKYYSDCKEYYDIQGYYHKECDEDNMISYKTIKEKTKNILSYGKEEKEKPKGNVW